MLKPVFTDYASQAAKMEPQFDADAYMFLHEALDFVFATRGKSPKRGHVRGQELLAGFRDLALREYGPLALTVLESWGVRSCEDVGIMVFHLVGLGAFGKTDDDSLADFANVFDFEAAFTTPFLPKKSVGAARSATKQSK